MLDFPRFIVIFATHGDTHLLYRKLAWEWPRIDGRDSASRRPGAVEALEPVVSTELNVNSPLPGEYRHDTLALARQRSNPAAWRGFRRGTA